MWNLTAEVKELFRKLNLLPIHESDEEWVYIIRVAEEEGEDLQARLKSELEEVREELAEVLPPRFHPYLDNGTLNQPTLPKPIREDYLAWVSEKSREFEGILDEAYQQKQKALPFLPQSVQEVFEDSLHDSIIQRIVRKENSLNLYINTDGGFSSKALIHLMFEGVKVEESSEPLQVGQWFIYDELQKTDDGYAYRVLFECPESEWTIHMKNLSAVYYYRPSLHTILRDEGKLEDTQLNDYLDQLKSSQSYWFITPDVTSAIESVSNPFLLKDGKVEISEMQLIVRVGKELFTYDLDDYNPIDFIYTDFYEDPYEKFQEPLPFEELESAALSDDLELQVRAWNTMYAHPTETAETINRILLQIVQTEENEMLLHVYTSHFYKEGILGKEVIERFLGVLG